ncbi:hypothetical protein J6590_099000 [Homalodisca vitripennis]|nr:hypothetical protein J6590_099000 [Homalodisca vitripennis]
MLSDSNSSSFFVTDNFWIRSDEHDSRFQESSLQQHRISNAARKRKGSSLHIVRQSRDSGLAAETGYGAECVMVTERISLVFGDYKDVIRSIKFFLMVDGPVASRTLRPSLRPLSSRILEFPW